jgi:hypothetical protein
MTVAFENVRQAEAAPHAAPHAAPAARIAAIQAMLADLWPRTMVSFGFALSLIWAGFLLWLCVRLFTLILVSSVR